MFTQENCKLNNLEPVQKKGRGGRKPGQTNLKTRVKLAQQQATDAAIKELAAHSDLENVTSLECLRICMRVALRSGNFDAARIAASELAPYEYAKRSPEPVETPLPADLIPDPDCIPAHDEEIPENPIL